MRYWDGSRWTDHVSDNGITSTDPLPPPGDVVGTAAASVAEAADGVASAAKRAWGAVARPATPASDLAILTDLRTRGILTEDEFAAARDRLTAPPA